jgi:hypothetical protein
MHDHFKGEQAARRKASLPWLLRFLSDSLSLPSMLIEEKALRHWIDNFFGYGSWRAPFWFIAYEESGGDLPEEVADRLNYFQRVHPEPASTLCDIREMYQDLAFRWDGPKACSYNNHHEYRFGNNAIQNNVWKNLTAFVHGYKNEKFPDPLNYQRHSFASSSAHNEALIRLYPLPSPHNHAWYYSWLDLPQLGFLKSRVQYQEHVYQHRIQTIFENIRAYKPEIVLMYGMSNINAIKKSVQDFFGGAEFRMIKATIPTGINHESIGGKIPQHHRADVEGTTMLITTQIPALRHNRIETGFDWEEFGRSVGDQNK